MPEPHSAPRGAARIEDAEIGDRPGASVTPSDAAAHAREAAATFSRYDDAAGWPPKLPGCKDVTMLRPERWQEPFPPRLQRQYVDAALRHPDVRSLLSGRFELLGCHLVDHKHRPQGRHCVRVCFADYTDEHLVDVYLRDLRVESVAKRPSHAHPEAPVEMAQAIALARSHPELSAHVQGLAAHAILQVPSPESPYRNHRCLLVTFTEDDDAHCERQALFMALVDLNLQRVLKAGRCPCQGGG